MRLVVTEKAREIRVAGKNYKAGEEFDIAEKQGRYLTALGRAAPVVAVTAEKAAAGKKAEKFPEPAQATPPAAPVPAPEPVVPPPPPADPQFGVDAGPGYATNEVTAGETADGDAGESGSEDGSASRRRGRYSRRDMRADG